MLVSDNEQDVCLCEAEITNIKLRMPPAPYTYTYDMSLTLSKPAQLCVSHALGTFTLALG